MKYIIALTLLVVIYIPTDSIPEGRQLEVIQALTAKAQELEELFHVNLTGLSNEQFIKNLSRLRDDHFKL